MSNSLGTKAGDLIASTALENLKKSFPAINLISRDFSDQPVLKGQTVISRIHTVPAAVDFDDAVGYVASATTVTDVPVTINKHKHVTVDFSEDELSSSGIDYIAEQADALAHSLGTAVYSDIFATAILDLFTNRSRVQLANFNRLNAIVNPRGELRGRLVNGNLLAVVSNSAETKLWGDDSFLSLLTNKAGGVGATELPVCHGVSIARCDTLASGINGVVLGRDAIVFASRTPKIETDVVNGIIRNVSDASGLTLQYRKFHNPVLGKVSLVYTLQYGVAVGRVASAQVLQEAALS